MRRVMRELSELKKSPPEGIRIQTSDEDMLDVTGIIEGPGEYNKWRVDTRRVQVERWLTTDLEGTPYAGGYFRVKFKFTEEFPAAPPKCTFFVLAELTFVVDLFGRLVRDQNLPPKCVKLGRDLCQHVEERLEIDLWDRTHTRDR
jgi:ubiquitin-protein ligase